MLKSVKPTSENALMDRYLQQLIEDLREAAGQVPEPGDLYRVSRSINS